MNATAEGAGSRLWLGVLAGAGAGFVALLAVPVAVAIYSLTDPTLSVDEQLQRISGFWTAMVGQALDGAVGDWVAARVHRGRWDLAPAVLLGVQSALILVWAGGRPDHVTTHQLLGFFVYAPTAFIAAYASRRRSTP